MISTYFLPIDIKKHDMSLKKDIKDWFVCKLQKQTNPVQIIIQLQIRLEKASFSEGFFFHQQKDFCSKGVNKWLDRYALTLIN